MSFEYRWATELQIAEAGGGFRLDAALRQTPDLMQIAAAPSGTGARVTFAGLNGAHPNEPFR